MKNIEKLVEENFGEELSQIKNGTLRDAVTNFFVQCVPAYFCTVPASSSGKYHPQADAGAGGLVRHTKMAVAFALDMSRIEEFADVNMDIVVAALLMHDTFKDGKEDYGHTIYEHGLVASTAWDDFVQENYPELCYLKQPISDCIKYHMGQWCDKKTLKEYENCEKTNVIRLTQYGDYISSRKTIDKYHGYEPDDV